MASVPTIIGCGHLNTRGSSGERLRRIIMQAATAMNAE